MQANTVITVIISHLIPWCQAGFAIMSTREDQRHLLSLWLDSDWEWQEGDWVTGVIDSQSCHSLYTHIHTKTHTT